MTAAEGAVVRGRAARARRPSSYLWWALALAVIGGLGVSAGNNYQITILVNLAVTLILTLSLNFVVGYSGQFTLAHSAFFGVGAYIAGIAAKAFAVPAILCLPISLGAVAALAIVVGIPAARFHGYYLAVATLAFGLLVEIIVRQSPGITGGAYGLTDIPDLSVFATITGRAYGFLAVGTLVIFILGHGNLLHSRLGRAVVAVRDNPAAAAAAGINTVHTRLFAFVISATAAGLAGWLHTFYYRALNPMLLSAEWTFIWLFMVLVGGIGHWQGVIIGTVLMALVPERLGFASDQTILMVGLLMIVAALFAPRGVGGLIDNLLAERGR